MYKIIKKQILSSSIKLMEIEAPKVAAKAKAGQFIIVRANETGERIPLTIADSNKNTGIITIIFQEVGYSTLELGRMEVGQSVTDFVGPLGKPSEIENYGEIICVGGGIGIAPIYPIAKALKNAGNKVISIIGARTKELLFWDDQMRQISDELYIATDDGSYGQQGFVTDILKNFLEQRKQIAKVWAIGPVVMMRAASNITKAFHVPTIVSMNPIMVDGTGMCGACRVAVNQETKFACVDGPEFDGHLVDWDLAERRLNMFKEEEKVILDKKLWR
ncbi:sulfide/dihydroorotate dehydrogenase-like FAD/NAD-binding protein [Bacillota bacterium LX-D]|nr:sulfide/dihydroorotate dehydrogenase-like FAD/NAD-binding protein [Bacillota bacterium LX-D]